MRKLIKKITQIMYKQFKMFWILFTLLFLLVSLYINWQVSLKKSHEALSEVALKITNNVDRFMDDLYQEMYALPVYKKNFLDCDTVLYPYLERITLNNPKITGLIVSTNNQLVCSTLTNNEGITLTSSRNHAILGPFNLSTFDQPVYLVQSKIGSHHLGILILAYQIKNILIPSDNNSSSIALYETETNKTIVKIDRKHGNSDWIFSKSLGPVLPNTSQTLLAFDKLQSIDGISVVVFESKTTLVRNLLINEIIVSLCVLFVFYLLYLVIINLMAKRYSLLGAMKLAIKNKEFYPEYQPLFDREIGRYCGVEVLLRWQDNQDKIIMPDFFIQEAESTGIIVPITLQIIEIAFKEAKEILTIYPDFHLAFNISALHFTDAHFFNIFNQLIKQYHITPSQIIFEVTERDLLDKNNAIFSEKMQELRHSGISLAVDDYGTGHASISYLRHFPFNYLKIDKLFIQAIGTKAITESLNDAIISMAKRLNLMIIAEGVETEEQVKYLSENGVRFLQGWYFSKAVPFEKIISLLQGEKNEPSS
jgi:sensor c-di-GMP phosphodiesterase-like protein